MAFSHGKDVVVVVDQYDLSAYFDDCSVPTTRDVAETTTFGKASKTYIPGLSDGTISLSGNYDGTAAAVDAVMQAALAAAGGQIISVGLAGLVLGAVVKMLKALETSYEVSGGIGDAVKVSAEAQASGGLGYGVDSGVSLHALSADTTPTNGASVNNGAATTTGWVAHFHATVFSGTNFTAKIQDSADNAAWADLSGATFTQITAIGKERLEGAAGATVRQYTRYVSAGTYTSVTHHVALSRR